ncbi:MAG TPA: hypothetical protein VLE91_02350, partial [Candidatus Saccharimonadales bacterium]|nr:hypothetical protein [Candidatus Saccharimonadales bacterium]
NCASGVYIPGLAPTYIATLPKDTKGGLSTMTNCTAGGFYRSFWYKSDGLNYKVSSHCAAEGTINAQDPLVDPCNTTVSWAIYNIGATCAAGY